MLTTAESAFIHRSVYLRFGRGNTSRAVCFLEEFWYIFRRSIFCYVEWKLKMSSCLILL